MSYTQRSGSASPYCLCTMSTGGSNQQVDVFSESWISGARTFSGTGLVYGSVLPASTAIGALGCTNQQITDRRELWGGVWDDQATAKAVSDDMFVTWADGVSWAVKSSQFNFPVPMNADRSRIVAIRMVAP